MCRGVGHEMGHRNACTVLPAVPKRGHSAFHSIWKLQPLTPFTVSLSVVPLRERSDIGTLGTSVGYLLNTTIVYGTCVSEPSGYKGQITSEIPNFSLIMLLVQSNIQTD